MNQWLSRAAVAVLILSISAIIFSEQRLKGPVSTPAVTEESLRSARDSRVGWLTHGRDWSNQRYAPFTEISRESVKRLQKVWDHRLVVRSSVRIQSTPLVIDHLLIYTDARDHVIAVDARSGQERWSYQPVLGPTALCCGFVNRGVAIYNDKVFVATLDARIIALDRRDGSVVWDVKAAEPKEGYSFTVAPLAADGKIIVGSSGGEFGIRGFVDAYDPDTGKRIWRFWTIPSHEEGGWYGRWAPTAPDGESLHRNINQEKRDSARYADAWNTGCPPAESPPRMAKGSRLPRAGTLGLGRRPG